MKHYPLLVGVLLLGACNPTLTPPVANQTPVSTLTPRTKGSTLEITPRTKGSTLLMGTVSWPEELPPPARMQFKIQALTETGSYELESDLMGRFQISGLPSRAKVRLVATDILQPMLKFKADLLTPAGPAVTSVQTSLSVDSTALCAFMDYAQAMDSPMQTVALNVFEDPEVQGLLQPVKSEMMGILKGPLQQEMEKAPEVMKALETARQNLEKMQQDSPGRMQG